MRNSQVFPHARALLLNSISTRIFFRMLWFFFLISIRATVVSVPQFSEKLLEAQFHVILFAKHCFLWLKLGSFSKAVGNLFEGKGYMFKTRTEFGQYHSTVHCLIPMVTSHNETGSFFMSSISWEDPLLPHINFPCTSTIGVSSPANSSLCFF